LKNFKKQKKKGKKKKKRKRNLRLPPEGLSYYFDLQDSRQANCPAGAHQGCREPDLSWKQQLSHPQLLLVIPTGRSRSVGRHAQWPKCASLCTISVSFRPPCIPTRFFAFLPARQIRGWVMNCISCLIPKASSWNQARPPHFFVHKISDLLLQDCSRENHFQVSLGISIAPFSDKPSTRTVP
jgi:hypothetical protein